MTVLQNDRGATCNANKSSVMSPQHNATKGGIVYMVKLFTHKFNSK